ELLRALLEMREILRLDGFAVGGLPLDRNQLVVDEAPQPGFEDSQLFRQLEIHSLRSLYVLQPQHPHVDRDGSGFAHHQRVDLDVSYPCAMIEKESRQPRGSCLERGAIGG